MEVLQTSALPLGYGALSGSTTKPRVSGREKVERETGFEPATSTLARSHSTTELFPPSATFKIPTRNAFVKRLGALIRRLESRIVRRGAA